MYSDHDDIPIEDQYFGKLPTNRAMWLVDDAVSLAFTKNVKYTKHIPVIKFEEIFNKVKDKLFNHLIDNNIHYEFDKPIVKNRAEIELLTLLGISIPEDLINPLDKLRPEWKPKQWVAKDPVRLPRLECLYGNHYWRGEVVVTIAPGGVGKSILSIAEALAMVTGEPLLGEPVDRMRRVMLLNFEDSALVLDHRITAAIKHYNLGEFLHNITERLYLEAMDSDLFSLTADGSGEVAQPTLDLLSETIAEKRIDVVVLDPWVSLHSVDGNFGHLVQPLVTALKRVAQASGACIEVVAHSRKGNGQPLTAEDMAGAMAFVNKTRHARVLNAMTASAAKRFGLGPHEAADFFRVDSAKHTHTGSTRPVWRRKIGIGLGNGYDDGEGCVIAESNIGVITAWTPPNGTVEVEPLEPDQVEAIKKAVEGGMDRRSVQSRQWAGNAVKSTLGFLKDDPIELLTIKAHLEALIDSGHLIETSRKVNGRDVPFLLPGSIHSL